MKKLFFLALAILAALIIANAGAWLQFPAYRFNPFLVFFVWIQYFPEVPGIIFASSGIGLFLLAFAIRMIFIDRLNPNDSLSDHESLTLLQRMFKLGSSKYGYAALIKNLKTLKKYLDKLELNFKSGILLGKMENEFIRSDKPYSCLVLAPPGTGKTAGVVIPNLLLCENSMLIHDPKGELYDTTAKTRQKRLKQKIFLFDPTINETAKFNIFAKSILPEDPNDIRAYIINVSNIIFSKDGSKNSSDDYFENAAKSAFTFFAQWLIHKHGETSISAIRQKLLEDADVVQTIEEMIADEGTPAHIQEDGRGVLIAAPSENQWAGVMGQLKEPLELFADPRIKNATDSTCDFTGNLLRQEKISVYLKIRDQDKRRLKPLIAMMLEAITTQLISKIPTQEDNQVTLALDEFVRLGKMNSIAELPAISRGYKVNLIFVAQDYEQISNVYGKEYLSIFESNCAYKIVFRQNNFLTAEKISKLIGNKTTKRESKSSSSKGVENLLAVLQDNKTKSQSVSQEGIALVSPQDILSLKYGHCIIVIQGHASRPIFATSPMFFNDKKLKELLVK